jgi:hypothetical protein
MNLWGVRVTIVMEVQQCLFLCSRSVRNATAIASVAMETQRLLRYVCGCQQYETQGGLRLKYVMFLSDFHQIWGSSTDSRKRRLYQF